MEVKGKAVWKFFSVITFAAAAVFIGLGMDKMFSYVYRNVYVGGDAYNYIINGNYATGFFVLAAMCALMGIGFIVLYYLSKLAAGQEALLPARKPVTNIQL